MKQKLFIIGALFFGLLAAYLTYEQINSERRKYESRVTTVRVVAAASDIIPGTTITENDLREIEVPQYVNQSTLSNQVQWSLRGRIIDKKAQNEIRAGAVVTWSDVDMGIDANTSFSHRLPNNGDFRAITIDVDQVSGVAGLIRPLDHVDIIGTFASPDNKGDMMRDLVTYTVLQNVVVLATGNDYGQNYTTTTTRNYTTVTLQVTQLEAELLVFARRKGDLSLTLRSKEDTRTNDKIKVINFKYLEDNVQDFATKRGKLRPSSY